MALIGAVRLPLTTTTPKLVADYSRYGAFVAARTALWQSADQASPLLVVKQAAPGAIVGGAVVAAGTYPAIEAATDVYARKIVAFFKKKQGRFENVSNP